MTTAQTAAIRTQAIEEFEAYEYLLIPEPLEGETQSEQLFATDDPQKALAQASQRADQLGRTIHIYKHRKIVRPGAGN